MALKRLLTKSGEKSSGLGPPNKIVRLSPNILREIRSARNMHESISYLEPMIQKIVQEEVSRAFDSFYSRSSTRRIEPSPSLQLLFADNLPDTMFTGNIISSTNRSPLLIKLYDPNSRNIVTTGPLSSAKVNLVVLDGDFVLDDGKDSSKKNFDGKIIRNREGKRPLLAGPLIIPLQNGVGHIREVSFTDNSKWTRSGKFRLGLKVCTSSDDELLLVREGVSNAFKVKDHRGEAYQKHYPPSLDDEVWRLVKIAQNGSYFKNLSKNGILCVRDFLRAYIVNEHSLRSVILGGIKTKAWQKIIEHAMTCVIDDKRYVYKAVCGFLLFFDSVYRVIGVSFNGHHYLPVEFLVAHQKKIVEDLKQRAYKNSKEITPISGSSNIDSSMLLLENPTANNLINSGFGLEDVHFQAEHGEQIRIDHPLTSPPYNSKFEFGESSTSHIHGPLDHQAFNSSFSPMNCHNDNYYIGGDFIGSQVSSDYPPHGGFQGELPPNWQRYNSFYGFNYQENVSLMPNTSQDIIMFKTKRARTSWCKVVAVLKWWILLKAARKWSHVLGCI